MDDSRIKYAEAFKYIAKATNSSLPLTKVLNSIAKNTTKALRAAGCAIMLLSPQKEHLNIIAAHGLSDLYLRKGIVNARKSLPDILDGKVVTIFDISQDEQTQYPEAAETEKIGSIIGAPLLQKGDIIGEVRVYGKEPKHFSKGDADFLTTVANIIAVTLERNNLYQMLTKAERPEKTSRRKKSTETPKPTPQSLRQSIFGHPSEEEFAKLLDFYRLEWLYEPRSFPLAWENGKVTEMFTPDFYLPDLDLYIELTTLKQSLVTEKNRKVRRLQELHPEINIKLLNKNDYLKLLAKYGYRAAGGAKVEGINRVLLSHTQIQRRVQALAEQISRDYAGRQLVLIGVLKGVICFMSDLMQHISLPLAIDFMAITSYGSGTESAVKITKDLDTDIANLHVLMVEDIVDTGMTLNYILGHLSSFKPATLRVCTLLDKRIRRLADVPLDYIGFEIPDEFVVGYGLDYHGEYRNLPFIGGLEPKLIEEEQLK
ncbi:MAG: hypoxanthine phosphoribosyltransferase [Chloroflexi bacterium]|nr:hypoxanthine phosphoribosyltransferase [Chloroflexota bacterium]MBM3172287.1 hypoxanthine phosphoribosyltransferase [Chloroflexota bacterium]MBM3174759.1 hypoxanthine phosphoribosyltransferase [Chloroflexota bacterium]MBM4449850.1 hypoxanthine phosphoribosyltransferase [Chloroflexota bacterium]